MNLPTWITVGRIALTPLVAWLPFVDSATLRGLAFVLYLVVAISDHYDGKLARERNEETDLGRLLDPLADKIFLLATFIPMYMLQAPRGEWLTHLLPRVAESSGYHFVTWFSPSVALPWWVLTIVLGREAAMTWFRWAANKRGVVIAARDLGKLKTWSQAIAVGVGGLQAAGAWHVDIAWWALLVALVLTWVSGLDYVRVAPQLLRQSAAAAP